MYKLAILCLCFVSCYHNRVDKRNFRQGFWKMYYDDEKKQLMWKGRYRDHHQVWRWKYYTSSGHIYLSERYRKNHQIQTIYYYPSGKKELQGTAVYFETLDTAYYRWEGDWVHFDSTGVIDKVSYYKYGKFAWLKPINSFKD